MPIREQDYRLSGLCARVLRGKFCALLLIAVAMLGFSPVLHGQERIPIVILDFEGYGISQPEAITLTNRLRNELFRFEQFQVVERGLMERILAEQNFQLTGCVSNECLVEIGRLVGARQAVGGSIGKVADVYSISARIIDVATGELLQVADYDVTGDLSLVLTEGMAQIAVLLAGAEAMRAPEQIRAVEATPPAEVPPAETGPPSRSVAIGLDFGMLIGLVDSEVEGVTRIVGISPMLGIAVKRYRAPAWSGQFNWYWGYGTDVFVLPYLILGGDYWFGGRVNTYLGVNLTVRTIKRLVPTPGIALGLYF